jgi:trigger factor
MEREVRNGLRNQVKQAAFDALVAANEIEVPASMVAQEIDRQRQQMIQQFTQQFGAQGAKHLIAACFQMNCSKNKLKNQ